MAMAPGATSAVLRQLADPVAAQVAHAVRTVELVPFNRSAPLARQVLARDVLDAGRTVISEEAYTEALGAVIEREFYPDLSRLQQQLQWLKALESGDPVAIEDAKANISQSVRRVDQLAVGTTPAPDAGSRRTFLGNQTPLISSRNTRAGAAPAEASSVVSSSAPVGSSVLDTLSLGAFQSTFVSEDTAAWSRNMAGAQAQRAKAHWWTRMHTGSKEWQLMLTDGHARRVAGDAGSLLLRDQAGSGVDLLQDRGLGVETKGRVRSWRYRPRNALFFAPELATSYDISRVAQEHRKPNPDLPVTTLADGHARSKETGQVGIGPAGALGLLKDVARMEHSGAASDAPKLLADGHAPHVGQSGTGQGTGAGTGRVSNAPQYAADDLDTGRYAGERVAQWSSSGRSLSAAYSGLDLVLPAAMIRGVRLRADGGVVQPADIQRHNTRLPGMVLLKQLQGVHAASGGPAARQPPADPLSLPEFRGYALLPTPLPSPTHTPAVAYSGPVPVPIRPQTAVEMAAAMGIRAEELHRDGGSSFSLPSARAREDVRDELLDKMKMGTGKKRRRDPSHTPGALMPPPPAVPPAAAGGTTRHKTPVFAAARTPSSLVGGPVRAGAGAGGAASVLGAQARSTLTGVSRGTTGTGVGAGGNLHAALASMTPAARRIAAQVAAQAGGPARGSSAGAAHGLGGVGFGVASSSKQLGTSRGSSQAR